MYRATAKTPAAAVACYTREMGIVPASRSPRLWWRRSFVPSTVSDHVVPSTLGEFGPDAAFLRAALDDDEELALLGKANVLTPPTFRLVSRIWWTRDVLESRSN